MSKSEQGYVIHDPIHGSFALPSIAWKIIDTPEFQRLRYIKQTGNTFLVFPGAEHTRFAHCIGVAHLSFEYAKALRTRYPELVSAHDTVLLCLAGLCHDLGHCAYSHLYDQHVIPEFNKTASNSDSICFITTHEEASILILERIIDKYSKTWEDTISIEDVYTIGKMILGSPTKVPPSLKTKLVWTEDEPNFLYQIVANEETGIDVDKFDYIKRDSLFCGIPCSFEPQRLLAFSEIIDGSLSYSNKADELILSMWNSRYELHRRVYQHRVVKCLDLMMLEMIMLCGDMPVPRTEIPLKKAHTNLDSYLLLTDNTILDIIESVPAAKSILDKVRKRELWKTIGTVIGDSKSDFSLDYPNIRIGKSVLQRGTVIHYIYLHDGEIPSDFYKELIKVANGAQIYLRE